MWGLTTESLDRAVVQHWSILDPFCNFCLCYDLLEELKLLIIQVSLSASGKNIPPEDKHYEIKLIEVCGVLVYQYVLNRCCVETLNATALREIFKFHKIKS